jgi:hypothetical protein
MPKPVRRCAEDKISCPCRESNANISVNTFRRLPSCISHPAYGFNISVACVIRQESQGDHLKNELCEINTYISSSYLTVNAG